MSQSAYKKGDFLKKIDRVAINADHARSLLLEAEMDLYLEFMTTCCLCEIESKKLNVYRGTTAAPGWIMVLGESIEKLNNLYWEIKQFQVTRTHNKIAFAKYKFLTATSPKGKIK